MGLLSQEGSGHPGRYLVSEKNITDLPGKDRRRLNGPETLAIFSKRGQLLCPIRNGGSPVIWRNDEGTQPDIEKKFQDRALRTAGKAWFSDGMRILKAIPSELSGGMQQKGRNCRSDAFKSLRSFWRMSRLRRTGCSGTEAGGRGDADGAQKLWHRYCPWCPTILVSPKPWQTGSW